MKTYTFRGMTTCTARYDYEIDVTAEDISENSKIFGTTSRKYSVEDVEAWTEAEVRAYMMEEKFWLDELSGCAAHALGDYDYEADEDFEVKVP